MVSKVYQVVILFILILLIVPSIYSQDTGIQDGEKLLVWIADAQRPGQQTAGEPGQLVWVDSQGNFETFMDLPPQSTQVMTCGRTASLSPDGETLAFYVGSDVGTLHILKGTDSLSVVDTDFHAMGCTGLGTFEFFHDSSKFAYIDYIPNSLLRESYGEGTLRIYNNATFEQIRSFETVTTFDVEGDQVAFATFFDNDQQEAVEAAIVLWDGETDQEVATLFAEDDCRYHSASVKLLTSGNIIAIMGHRCSVDTRTSWQYYVIDPVNRTATQITQDTQPGQFFAFSRTNSIFASPDGATTYFTVPDGLTNHTVSLMSVDMSNMAVTPVVPQYVIMPRYTNNPYAAENHPTIQSVDDVWLSMVRNDANNEAVLSVFDLTQPGLPPIDLSAGSRGDQIIEMEFTPDNTRVIYVAGGDNGDDNSLWGVDLATGNNFRIRRGRYGWGVISPDGGRMALINWEPTEGNRAPYATLVIVDIESSAETLLFQGGEVVNNDLTGVRFALPIAWRR